MATYSKVKLSGTPADGRNIKVVPYRDGGNNDPYRRSGALRIWMRCGCTRATLICVG